MTAVQFWALAVADLGLAEWYVEHFGFAVAHRLHPPDGSDVAILRNDRAVIELKQRVEHVDRAAGADGYFKVGWFVSSVDEERARLAAAGVNELSEIVDQPEVGLRFFFVTDPEGNLVQLFDQIRAP